MNLNRRFLIAITSFFGLIFLLGSFSCTVSTKNNQEFYAYYTHLKSDEPFEKYSRTTEYADIIVNIGENEQLVFWRGTSFLPYWETLKGKWPVEEIIPRKGNGTQTMPDATNMFSTIRLIENLPEKVVVLWRYLPEFEMNNYPHFPIKADPLAFVEELFTITPDGNVVREIRKGTARIDDWNNAQNKTIQTFTLKTSGISNTKTDNLTGSVISEKIAGNPVVAKTVETPVISFNFDEASGNQTSELISKSSYEIASHKSMWRKGVSGTALQFDGYTSSVTLPADKTPVVSDALTIEAWIAIAAYPWNWVPFLQQTDSLGFALGLSDNGEPTIQVGIGPKLFKLTSKTHLERNSWIHLAGSFEKNKGKLVIYVNGNPTDSLVIPKQSLNITGKAIRIGSSGTKSLASNPVRPQVNFPTEFGFDGLIDEIRVYDKALSKIQVLESFRNFVADEKLLQSPDMEIRKLPETNRIGKFGGYYTNLKYYEAWDNMWRFGDSPDVVVEFDNSPTKFIFWKGMNYIPAISNDKNQWYSNEFNETWGTGGGDGCQEPMSDKNLLTTNARIVEQSDARVVVNWRCALMDTKMNTQANYDTISGWGDWIDWNYTIYPDGVAVKQMRLWTNGKLNHEWQEGMVIMGENTRPEDVIEQSPVYYFVSDKGETLAANWADANDVKIDYSDKRIFVANLKSDWDPYSICDFTRGDIYNSKEVSPYSVFCNWNHWPTALVKSDGRYSSYPDRISHSSLNHFFWDEYSNHTSEPAPYQEKLLIEGMSDKKPEELYPLSSSWLSPAKILPVTGIENAVYNPAQRAYDIQAKENKLGFKILATSENPVVNLCFVVKNWNSSKVASVEINKNKPEQKFIRQGVIRDTDGKQALIVWIDIKTTEEILVDIR